MPETVYPVCVIIGATSPIARAFAAACARQGSPLLLAGRNQAEMELIAADLRLRYQVQVDTAFYDASIRGAGRELACKVSARHISSIVAFHGIMGEREDFQEMMQVNCTSIAELFEAFADEAVSHGRHPVLAAVSSVAGDRGRQSNYPYGATKAALDAYLSGLRNRLHPLGIRVLTIKPGFVRTRLTLGKVSQSSPLLAEPALVANDIVRAIKGNGSVIYTPWFWRPIMWFIRALPEPVFKRLKL